MSFQIEKEIVESNKAPLVWGTVSFTPNQFAHSQSYFRNDILVVLDISASMAVDEKLDNAKLAIMHMISRLDKQDNFALIAYNHEVDSVISFMGCTPENKKMFEERLQDIKPSGSTNTNTALISAVKLLKNRESLSNLASVFLFSDGDNLFHHSTPEQKIVEIRKIERPTGCTFNIFGFGVDHDSHFLYGVSQHFRGVYNFIECPNQTTEIVGACLDIIQKTKATKLMVNIDCFDGCRLFAWSTSSIVREKRKSKNYDFHIGTISDGETKTIIFQFSLRQLQCTYTMHLLANIKATYVTSAGTVETIGMPISVLRTSSASLNLNSPSGEPIFRLSENLIPPELGAHLNRMKTVMDMQKCISEKNPIKIGEMLRQIMGYTSEVKTLKQILETCQQDTPVRQHLICSLVSSLFAERLLDFKMRLYDNATLSYLNYI